jgi:putative ABC transport system permease protein
MLRNYLTVALRSLRRRPGFAVINVCGLAIGIASCAVIALYLWGELSYDRFHDEPDRVFRVESTWGDGDFSLPATNWPFVEALRVEQPELTIATLLRTNGILRRGDQSFREDVILFANAEFFEVFSFTLDRGDHARALTEPGSVVLTRETAARLFGDEDPLDQTIRAFGDAEFVVTGVLAPPAGPSHVPLAAVFSFPTLEAMGWTANQQWGNNSVLTYLRLPAGAEPATLAGSLQEIAERHAGDSWNGSVLGLQPLTSIHLHSNHSAELQAGGNPAYVTLFAIVALFILLLAGVNYLNLSTARSLDRAREVGLRKSVGAAEGQLTRQFLAEAVLLSLLALGVAAAMVAVALAPLADLVGRSLVPDSGALLVGALTATVLAVVIGVGGGLYPAFALARFRPAEVLRGRFSASRGGARLRQGLVVFQFAIAVILLVGTLVVYGQLEHVRAADLGFEEEQVLALRGANASAVQRVAFFNALVGDGAIVGAASMTEPFPAELLSGWGLTLPGAVMAEEQEGAMSTRAVTVSADFFGTLGVPMLAGRDFRAGSPVDSAGVVLNRSAATRLAAQRPDLYPSERDLIGAEVHGMSVGTVIGITEDFHMASLHHAVEPIAFFLGPANATYLVRTAPGAAAPAIDRLRETWAAHFPDTPLDYRFADDAFAAAFATEEQVGRLALLFSGLAILVACLGLFGLAAHAATRRRREISVRKVLGATVPGVVLLLSRDFVRLVALSVLVAAPLAYAAMSRWLESFPARMDLGAGPFLAAGLLAVLVALVTVAGLAYRAASTDPAVALRSDS